MSVRLVCDQCSGELEIPRVAPGRVYHCPECGEALNPTATSKLARTPTPVRHRDDFAAPHPDRDFDDGVAWFAWLGAIAPAILLALVAVEPIAIGVTIALVAVGLFVATRVGWSHASRGMGLASLTLLSLTLAVSANLFGQGNLPTLGTRLRALVVPPSNDSVPLAEAEWRSFTTADGIAAVEFPGTVVSSTIQESSGVTVSVFESKFPRQGATFALHTFQISPSDLNEAGEAAGLERVYDLSQRIFADAVAEMQNKRAFSFEHPGFEEVFNVLGKPTTIVCRGYLVRNTAYLLSVSADKSAAVRESMERFLSSFRLARAVAPLRGPRPVVDLGWEEAGRPPILRPTPLISLGGHSRAPIVVLAFSEDGSQLLTGSGREHLVLWKLESGLGNMVVGAEGYPFYAPLPSGKTLALPFSDGVGGTTELRFIDLRGVVPRLGRANTDLIVFPDASSAVVALGSDIAAWNTSDGELLWKRQTGGGGVVCQALTSDGTLLAAAGAQGVIRLFDVSKKGADVAQWSAHVVNDGVHGPIQQLAFSPSGKTLASAGIDNAVRLWDVSSPQSPKLTAIMLHEAPVHCVEFSNDGKWIATGDFLGVVRIWHADNGKLRHEFRASESPEAAQALRFSPDDAVLAVAGTTGISRYGVHLYEVRSLPRERDSASITFQVTDEPPLFKKP